MVTGDQKACAPIVMIAYNRPDLLRLSMRNVALADGADGHEIFVFVDGPRSSDDIIKQNDIHAIVTSYQQEKLPKLKIIKRERNYGCRDNIVDAISQVISKYGKAIIIEDDILISRTFLEYMDEALAFYKDDKSIWSINAYQSPNLRIPKDYPYDVYLNPVNMCWGWGTWVDRWEQVDFDMKDWSTLRNDPEIIRKLNSSGRHLLGLIESQAAGTLETWDVQCAYHVVKNGLMSIEPKYQLSKNIGFSTIAGGVHNKTDQPYVTRQPYYNFLPKLVHGLSHDPRIFHQFEWAVRPRNLTARIIRKLQRTMANFSPLNMEPNDILGIILGVFISAKAILG